MADLITMDASEGRRCVSEEAAAWWVRLQSENLARNEREQFVDWLRESVAHVAELLRLASMHEVLAEFRNWADIHTEGEHEDQEVVVESQPSPHCAPGAGGSESERLG
jgi:transmembrane sensor